MQKAQSTVLQSKSISSPPVRGMTKLGAVVVGVSVSVVPGLLSFTWTTNVLVAVLPCESVAVQVTVAVPTGKAVPEAGVQLTLTLASQASVAVAEYVTGVPFGKTAIDLLSRPFDQAAFTAGFQLIKQGVNF